jgi:DHA1 family bicyclomycin/chloramphenicol resistance-like MFS transporter
VSHAAVLGFIAFALIHAAVAYAGHETVLAFVILQSAMMFCFAWWLQLNAMAMEPLGHIAGTASSVQGFVTTIGAALIGAFIASSSTAR